MSGAADGGARPEPANPLSHRVLLTGVPRAGTTLTVELLAKLPDCVGLDEPMDAETLLDGARHPAGAWAAMRCRLSHKPLPTGRLDPERVADNVMRFCDDMRRSALERGVVVTKHMGGAVSGSRVAEGSEHGGARKSLASREEIPVGKPLSPDFTLFVKHNSAFTGILTQLCERGPVFAIVRNPLAVLASWNTVPFPVSRGRAHAAERFDSRLAQTLAGMSDVYARQIHLLAWFFGRFEELLGSERTVRYEDIIASEGRALDVIHPSAAEASTPLASRNRSKIYDETTMYELGRRLLDTEGPFWNFYDRDDVLGLMPV